MPNYRRARTKGGIYFFTVVTHNREPLFSRPSHIKTLQLIIEDVRNERVFTEIACVILPDHIHALWKLPEGDDDYSKRWGLIKARFTKTLRTGNQHVGRALPDMSPAVNAPQIWQKRFWEHQIRNEVDLNNHIDYTHFNPVKHGLVKNVGDWQYSSFHRFVKAGAYPEDWSAEVTMRDDIDYGE